MTDTRRVFKLSSALLASAKTVTVVVGGNGTTQDASLIFQPQEVNADVGDFVVFNCTSTSYSLLSPFDILHMTLLNSDRVSVPSLQLQMGRTPS